VDIYIYIKVIPQLQLIAPSALEAIKAVAAHHLAQKPHLANLGSRRVHQLETAKIKDFGQKSV